MENNQTPLWLELRKEYIDDNFEKLLSYLKLYNGMGSNDTFYNTTLSLLRMRVKDMVGNIARMPIYNEEEAGEHAFNVRLLGAYLLVEPNSSLALPAFTAMMSELRRMVNENKWDGIMHTVTNRMMQERIADYGYTWDDITSLQPEILVYKITNSIPSEPTLSKTLAYSNYGTALLTKKGLELYPETYTTAVGMAKTAVRSMETPLMMALCTRAGQKLKKSRENNLMDMDDFVKDFVMEQYSAKPKKVKLNLLRYATGDDAVVRIEMIAPDGTIRVTTVDERYERLAGELKFNRQNIIYYDKTCFSKYLRVGDYLQTKVMDAEKGHFDIEKHFVEFVVEDCRENYGFSDMECKAIVKVGGAMIWLNARGAAIYTPNNGSYNIGSRAIVAITDYCTGKQYGKIKGEVVEPYTSDEDFDDKEYQRDCVEGFADSTVLPQKMEKKEGAEGMPAEMLLLLSRLLFEYQKTLLKPSERFRYISIARVMAEMADDSVSASYLNFNGTYLKVLVQFVNREDISGMELDPDDEYKDAISTLKRLSILEILKEYGKKEDSALLAQTIQDFQDTIPMLASLARLVQTANSMQGTLSDAAINVIRREIVKTLSIETENDADLEADGKSYLGLESGTQEFKSSMIYPAGNNMQPNEKVQNHNVMKGVCAFLNSTTGGVLYLGVNDQGCVMGLDRDFKYLGISDMDHYIRYVQDCAFRCLGKDSMVYLNRIEPMYEGKVVAIHVEPHPYRVVELNGVAYLRVNAESREMPETTRQEMIAKKVFKDKNKAAAISHLEHAYSQKRCVKLHNYASGNSGVMSDRHVEAYEVLSEDGLVICYDLDKCGIRVFNISRIGYVEVLDDEPWQHIDLHVMKNVDTFHMTGDKEISISLELDLMAKNLLVEEFPRAKSHLTPQKGNANVWYYTDLVYAPEGIGRFYIGLANHIKILSGDELKRYVEDYKNQYL